MNRDTIHYPRGFLQVYKEGPWSYTIYIFPLIPTTGRLEFYPSTGT